MSPQQTDNEITSRPWVPKSCEHPFVQLPDTIEEQISIHIPIRDRANGAVQSTLCCLELLEEFKVSARASHGRGHAFPLVLHNYPFHSIDTSVRSGRGLHTHLRQATRIMYSWCLSPKLFLHNDLLANPTCLSSFLRLAPLAVPDLASNVVLFVSDRFAIATSCSRSNGLC